MGSTFNRYIIDFSITVDIFLVIRGYVTAHSFNVKKIKGVKFNLIKYYLHRYLRITPTLAASVLLSTVLIYYFDNGPFWKNANGLIGEPCREAWWTVILYVQNYCSNPVLVR